MNSDLLLAAVDRRRLALGFTLLNPSPVDHQILNRGTRYKGGELHATNDPEVSYRIRVFGDFTDYYYYLGDKCGGYVTLEKLDSLDIQAFKSVGFSTIRIPHVGMRELAGRGIPLQKYTEVLAEGTVLAAVTQTPGASKLWESIARKTGAQIAHFDIDTATFVDTLIGASVWKLLVPKSLVHKIRR